MNMKPLLCSDISTFDTFVANASKAVLAVHMHPDGDAVGSAVAMRSYLAGNRGMAVSIIYPDHPSDTLDFLVAEGADSLCYADDPVLAAEAIAEADLIICLDCASFERTGDMCGNLLASSARKVLVDHHLFPKSEDFDLVFSDTEVSSACELLFEVLKAMPDVGGDCRILPAGCLSALMTGMTTDTNNFANSVFPGTLRMASELLDAGVDRDSILEHLYNAYRENRLRMTGYLLSEKLRISDEGVAYAVLTSEEIERYDIKEGELEGFVNMPLSIGNVRLSIFLKEDDGFFRVSLRSRKGTSANRCASAYFHGGGHEQASGGRLYFPGDIGCAGEAESYVLRVTNEFFTSQA